VSIGQQALNGKAAHAACCAKNDHFHSFLLNKLSLS
jgi:hypothetical protein